MYGHVPVCMANEVAYASIGILSTAFAFFWLCLLCNLFRELRWIRRMRKQRAAGLPTDEEIAAAAAAHANSCTDSSTPSRTFSSVYSLHDLSILETSASSTPDEEPSPVTSPSTPSSCPDVTTQPAESETLLMTSFRTYGTRPFSDYKEYYV